MRKWLRENSSFENVGRASGPQPHANFQVPAAALIGVASAGESNAVILRGRLRSRQHDSIQHETFTSAPTASRLAAEQ
jgi:hypothetical protein